MLKYADDITISVPIKAYFDTALAEILLHRRTSELAPPPVPGIQRKECLKLSGITFHEDPCIWDLHIDSFLSRAASRRYNYS